MQFCSYFGDKPNKSANKTNANKRIRGEERAKEKEYMMYIIKL